MLEFQVYHRETFYFILLRGKEHIFVFKKITQKFVFSFLGKQLSLSLVECCCKIHCYSYEIREVTESGCYWVISLALSLLGRALSLCSSHKVMTEPSTYSKQRHISNLDVRSALFVAYVL